MIEYPRVTDCPFCAMPASQRRNATELAFAFRDRHPASPGHSLIVPTRHIASLCEASPAEQAALLAVLGVSRRSLDGELAPDGYNIGINDGIAAGQTVGHLHIHLIPRFAGDVPDPRGGIRHCIPGKGYYPGAGQ